MEYPQAGFLKEFVKRTQVNLKVIEQQAKENPESAFEVTQLLNSLFGLLILPEQKYYKLIYDLEADKTQQPCFTKLKESGRITYKKTAEKESQQKKKDQSKKNSISHMNQDMNVDKEIVYGDFIRHLRNSICHPKNTDIGQHQEGGEIKRFLFKDTKDNFSVALNIEELKAVCEELCEALIKELEKVEGY